MAYNIKKFEQKVDKAHLLIEADARAWLASNLILMEEHAWLQAPALLRTGLLFGRWGEGAHLSDRRGERDLLLNELEVAGG